MKSKRFHHYLITPYYDTIPGSYPYEATSKRPTSLFFDVKCSTSNQLTTQCSRLILSFQERFWPSFSEL